MTVMKKPEILLLKPIYAPTMAALERDYVVHKPWQTPDAGAQPRALVTTTATGLTRADVDACSRLEIVACFGSHRGNFDMAACAERGIVVAATPDVIDSTVADLTF